MIKITLLLVGKTNPDFLDQGVKEFDKRIKRYTTFEIKTLKGLKSSKSMSSKIIKENEGEQILKQVLPNDYLILLDENGRQYTSVDFSKTIEHKSITGIKHIVFLIGGAFGFSEKVYERANENLSLSKMTFSHQVIRLLFLEQLYRAFTIINGEPYHNE